jgi:hypothetical protein
MDKKQNEIDRSKLKSFRDLSSLTKRNTYFGRRSRTPKSPKRRLELQRAPIQESIAENRRTPIPRRIRVPHTYKITRKSSMKISGYRREFQIFFGDEPIYHSKIKPYSSSNQIGISEGTESHISSPKFEAVLLFSENFSSFSLRKGSAFGDELMCINFKKDKELKPRSMNIVFIRHPPSVPREMNTVEPEATDDMKWVVDLNSDDVIASIKNCRLEDEDSLDYIIIRKAYEDCLEVETTLNISALYVFAIAISSFLFK